MASIIKIKRSITAGAPPTLVAGELAYSFAPADTVQGGDRLYIGSGASLAVIGGKYFTDKLDHTPGVLTATSAIITDANNKIDLLNVDNISINENTISTTNTNGNLVLSPNGTGKVSIAGIYTLPRADGAAGQVLATDGQGNVTFQSASTSITIGADIGEDYVVNLLSDVLTFSGSGAINTTVNNNEITISASDATSITKGVASFASQDFSVSSGAVSINETRIQEIAGGMVSGTGANQVNITVTYNSANGKFSFSVPTATANTRGAANFSASYFSINNGDVSINDATTSTKGIASFNTSNFDVASGAVSTKAITLGSTTLANGSTVTDVTGLTSFQVDNIKLDGYEISSTDPVIADVDLSLKPKGAGNINVNSARITGLAEPVNPTDAATKGYVDAARSGLDVKQSVRAATTEPITLSGIQTIDNVSLAAGDRVLVKDQNDQAFNGVYVVDALAWSRADDFDEDEEVTAGVFFFVEEGQTHADSGWVLTADNPLTVGTSQLTFTQFSGAGQIIAGAAITKTGNQLDVAVAANGGIEIAGDELQLKSNLAGNGLTYLNGILDVGGTADRISVTSNSVDISINYAGQASINTVGTIASGVWQATEVGAAYGGTGRSTYNNFDILVGSVTTGLNVLAMGQAGKFLQVNAAGNALEYADIDGGEYS